MEMGEYALYEDRMFDRASEQLTNDRVVVVEGGRIMAVGAAGSVELSDSCERIKLTGCTIMPGLIDCHAISPEIEKETILPWN